MSLPPGMREATPQRTQQDIPQLTVGQRLETLITSMIPSTFGTGEEARDQLQFDVKLVPGGYEARGWISYYKIPNPKQKIGKLYLAIQRITGKTYQNVDEAMSALREYGRIYFEVTGSRKVGETTYPKFAIVGETLPGEQVGTSITQPQAQHMQPPYDASKQVPPALENANVNSLSTAAYLWLTVSQALIGNQIPDITWNQIRASGVVQDLAKYSLIEMRADLPYLSEEARKYL